MERPECSKSEGDHRFDTRVEADKLKLLYHHSFPAVFVSMTAATLLATGVWEHVERTAMLVWMGAIFASSALRLVLFLAYRRDAPEGESILAWARPYFVTLLFSALVWGVGCVLIMPDDSLLYQSIIYFYLMGMAGGALLLYSAIRLYVVSAITAVLLPTTVWFLTQGETIPVCMGIGGCIFLLSSLRSTTVLAITLDRSFLLTHELTAATAVAERLARTDTLTGLNNRRAFSELAEAQTHYCQRHGHPTSVLVLDVDHFKRINDSLGHSSGDLALQHLAQILQATVRSSDICGRLGGEEFAVLLPSTGLMEAAGVAEKLRSTIAAQPVRTPSGEFFITSSFGVATGNADTEQLLNMADAAMYQAKQVGRNRVVCHDTWVDGTDATAARDLIA